MVKSKAYDIYVTGSGVVEKEHAPSVMQELEKMGGLFYSDIEMNGLVLIEKAT